MGTQKQLGKNIKKARVKAGWTHDQLAKKIDISVNRLRRAEQGEARMTYLLLVKIIKTLQAKAVDLVPF